MGNCCGASSPPPSPVSRPGGAPAFSGPGHVLGSRPSARPLPPRAAAAVVAEEGARAPTDEGGEAAAAAQRRERALAAEERIRKQGGEVGPKKKKPPAGALKGPNSEPLMRWS